MKSQHAKAEWEKSHLLESCVSSQSLSHDGTTAVSNHTLHTPTAPSILTQTPSRLHPIHILELNSVFIVSYLKSFLRIVSYLAYFSNSSRVRIIIVMKWISPRILSLSLSYTFTTGLKLQQRWSSQKVPEIIHFQWEPVIWDAVCKRACRRCDRVEQSLTEIQWLPMGESGAHVSRHLIQIVTAVG